MRRFEFMLVAVRGDCNAADRLSQLGEEGWDVAAAYATRDGTSTVMVHHYVMRREIYAEPPKEPDMAAPQSPRSRGRR
jgi:hypothetical protein